MRFIMILYFSLNSIRCVFFRGRVIFGCIFTTMNIFSIFISWSVERYGELLTTGGGKERMIRHFDETNWPNGFDDRSALIALLHKKKTELFTKLIEQGALPLRPGVTRLVDEALSSNIPIAVCSTSAEKSVRTILT